MSNYQDENLRKVQQHLTEAGEGMLSWLDDNSTDEMKRSFYKDGAELAGFIVSTAQDLQDFLLKKLDELDSHVTGNNRPDNTEDPFEQLHDATQEKTNSEFEQLIAESIFKDIRDNVQEEEEDETITSGLHQFGNDIQESFEDTSLPDVNSWWGKVTSQEEEDTRTPLEKAQEVSDVLSRAGLSTSIIRTGLNIYSVYATSDSHARSTVYVTDKTTAKDIENVTHEVIGLLRPDGLSEEERQSILDKMQKVLVKIRKENPRIRYSRKPRFTFPQGETYGLVYWYNNQGEKVHHEVYLSTNDEDIYDIVEQYFFQA